MQTIAHRVHEAIDHGSHFHIDLERRTLTLDGHPVALPSVVAPCDPKYYFTQCVSVLEILYNRFRHSLCGDSDQQDQSPYFKALDYDDLTDDDRLCGERRDHCRFQLEWQVLSFILSGELTWPKSMADKFFWRSPTEPDFVIMRRWIEPDYKPTQPYKK